MPKRASTVDTVDPVRSRLAAAVASPAPKQQKPIDPEPSDPEVGDESPPRSVVEAPKSSPPVSRPVLPRQERRRPEPRSLTVPRKFMLTPEEAERMDQTIYAISQAFGSRVTYSQVSRALWAILAGAEDALAGNPRRGQPLRVPSRGDPLAMAEYEEAIVDYLQLALKRS